MAVQQPGSSYRYRIDPEDRIASVSKEWREFARRNEAASLTDGLIGRPLWEFVSGGETRHLYELIFARVRSEGQAASFPFRCDAPDRRRYMRLSIAPLEDGGLEIEGRMEHEEARPWVALLDPSVSRSAELLTICSWCKCVRLPGEEAGEPRPEQWVEIEDAVRRLELFSARRLPQLSHGLCDACDTKIRGGD